MNKLQRKTWTENDRLTLIDDWNKIGSVWLIAIHMDRSKASVRAQATRLGLGKRETTGRNAKCPWNEQEKSQLDNKLKLFRDRDGKILIVELAEELGRDVDAVMDRLARIFNSEQKLLDSINVTRFERRNVFVRPKIKDRRHVQMDRKCMTCGNIFWSDGAHNRICNACKESDGLLDWDSYPEFPAKKQ